MDNREGKEAKQGPAGRLRAQVTSPARHWPRSRVGGKRKLSGTPICWHLGGASPVLAALQRGCQSGGWAQRTQAKGGAQTGKGTEALWVEQQQIAWQPKGKGLQGGGWGSPQASVSGGRWNWGKSYGPRTPIVMLILPLGEHVATL